MILFDAADGERLDFFSAPNSPTSLAFSPDSHFLAEAHWVSTDEAHTTGEIAGMEIFKPVLAVHEVDGGETVLTQDLSGRGCGQDNAWDLAYAPDGQTLLFRDYYSWLGHDRVDNICLLSAANGSHIRTIPVDLPWEAASPA